MSLERQFMRTCVSIFFAIMASSVFKRDPKISIGDP